MARDPSINCSKKFGLGPEVDRCANAGRHGTGPFFRCLIWAAFANHGTTLIDRPEASNNTAFDVEVEALAGGIVEAANRSGHRAGHENRIGTM